MDPATLVVAGGVAGRSFGGGWMPRNYAGLTFSARGPLGPWPMSYVTI